MSPRITWQFEHRSPLSLLTAGFSLLFLTLTLGVLLLLGRLKHAEIHSAVAEQLTTEGSALTRYIIDLPLWEETNSVALAWLRLPFMVEALNRAQSGLQYIEVTQDGVVLFHHQASAAPDGSGSHPEQAGMAEMLSHQTSDHSPVSINRELLDLFGEAVPVVVFKQSARHANGSLVEVEIGMRQAALDNREAHTLQIVQWIVHLAIFLLILSVLFSIGVTLIAAHRDRRHQQRQRQEEHLVFSGMVANSIVHDFRNPMSAVRLDAQMLEREARRDDARPQRMGELAGRIARTLGRMDNIFKEFLFLSRPATTSDNAPFDLVRSLHDCCETLAARAEQAQVTLDLSLPTHTTCLATGSEPALRRALINVLQNALQHAPANSRVLLSLSPTNDKRHWQIEVSDRGPGIPAAQRELIFKMFYTTRPEGTGLGLAMARAALANVGGTIVATDHQGGGATIRITLPCSRAARAEVEEAKHVDQVVDS